MKRIIGTITVIIVALAEVLFLGKVNTPKAWEIANKNL